MRMLLATMLLGLLAAGCENRAETLAPGQGNAQADPAGAIEKVLAEHRAALREADREIKGWEKKAQAASRLVARLEAIDTSAAPSDFRVAYIRHLQAWRAYNARIQTLPAGQLGKSALLILDIALARRTSAGAAKEILDPLRSAFDAVVQTGNEVEVAAVKHGAKTH